LVPNIPLSTQQAIAATLSCLDDKIALNSRINANLEAQAQAIFKSWFVDFEPFKDGGFVDSELGRIPKGWRVGRLTDIVDVLGGGTPKTNNKDYWNGDIPFFAPKDITGNYVIKTDKYITQEGLMKCNSRLYHKNTVFITARGTVGKIVLSGCDMAMSQTSYALIGKHDNSQFYIYQLAQAIANNLKHKAMGAVFDAIVTRDFDSELIIIPKYSIVKDYSAIVGPFYEKMFSLTEENFTLAAIRDALLPKLMSGEIEVEEEE
jgi:type I restriction enzyme S subunit